MILSQPQFSANIALLGGSFDPLHIGHVRLAESCLKAIPQLDELLFVPCYHSPLKEGSVATAKERLRQLEIGLEGTGFHIWDWELQRDHRSYTIDTLREAHQRGASRDRLYWLVGADAYASLPRWREPEAIRELCQIVVGNRPGHTVKLWSAEDILVTMEPCSAASHEIRTILAQNEVPADLLPDSLEAEYRRLFLKSLNPYAK